MSGIDYQPQRNTKETVELRGGVLRKLWVAVQTLIILLTFILGLYGNKIVTTVTTITTIPTTINLSRLWVSKIL